MLSNNELCKYPAVSVALCYKHDNLRHPRYRYVADVFGRNAHPGHFGTDTNVTRFYGHQLAS